MYQLVLVANPKGGTGKSTLALFIAQYLHFTKKKRVLLIDSDPQRSLINIKKSQLKSGEDLSKGLPVEEFISSKAANWKSFLTECLKKGYETLVVDSPGNFGFEERSYLIRAATTILIPTVAQQMAIDTTVQFAREVRKIDGDEKNVLTIASLARRTRELDQIKIIEQAGIKYVGALPERIKYARHRDLTQQLDDRTLRKLMSKLYKRLT